MCKLPKNAKNIRIFLIKSKLNDGVKDSLEKAVSMKVNYKDEKGKNVEEKLWTYKTTWNKEGTKAYLVSDIIPIPNYTSYMLIEISKDRNKDEKTIKIVQSPSGFPKPYSAIVQDAKTFSNILDSLSLS